jgi:hypothetical protein
MWTAVLFIHITSGALAFVNLGFGSVLGGRSPPWSQPR